MIIKTTSLERVAVKESQYPEGNLPEIAFAGRSNVGKSSLLNCLIQRKNLARTSGKPGKTRTINFYRVNDQLRLVDLPGYGFAQVSKEEKDKWTKTIETYLTKRANLKAVLLLVDCRHCPTLQDQMMLQWILDCGFKDYVIATKSDKLARSKIPGRIKEIHEVLTTPNERIFPFSATKKIGIEAIWEALEREIGQDEE